MDLYDVIQKVRADFPEVPFPSPAKEPVWWGRDGRTLVEGRYALVDTITDPGKPAIFSIPSTEYGLRYHEEVIAHLQDVCKEMPEFGPPEFSIKMPYEGRKMTVNIVFPDVEYKIKGRHHHNGDTVNPRIKAVNSYDLSKKLSADFGAYRLICSNGLMVGEKWASLAKRHIDSLSVPLMVADIKVAMKRFSDQTGIWQKWAELQISKADYDTIWEALPFSSKEKEKIESLPEAGTQLLLPDAITRNELTLWDFSNVVTQYVTHGEMAEARRLDAEPEVARVFQGYAHRVIH